MGIAAKDDLDAQESSQDGPPRNKAPEVDRAPNPSSALARSNRFPVVNTVTPPVRETLSAEQSAAARTQLIQEIQTLPDDDLQSKAIAILKAKNCFLAGDAKLVEEALAARMVLQGEMSEAVLQDEPKSVSTDLGRSHPPLASTSPKTAEGTPQKGQSYDRRCRAIIDRVGIRHQR